MLTVGETAPDFTLDSTQGSFTLSALQGSSYAVIIFYPKDNTPGWNRQLCAARDAADEYASHSVQIVAVNPGSLPSHQEWAEEFGFGFPICVDVDANVARAYDSLKPEGGVRRSVYVVDKQGRIIFAETGAPETSVILAAVDGAQA